MYGVTIVIPVYKSYDFLDRCVNSIIQNNILDFDIEIYFIDDSPNMQFNWNNYLSNLNYLNLSLKVLINNKNMGVTFSRNKGFLNAKYNMIVFLDSDDELTKNALNKIFTVFNMTNSRNPKVFLFATQVSNGTECFTGSVNCLLNDYNKGERLVVMSKTNNKPFLGFLRGHEFAGLLNYYNKTNCSFYVSNEIVRKYNFDNPQSISLKKDRLALIGLGHFISSKFFLRQKNIKYYIVFLLKYFYVRFKYYANKI